MAVSLGDLLLLILAGCSFGARPVKDASALAPVAFPLTFAPSASYATALQEITDVGLQPAVYCGSEADRAAGRIITDLRWQPAGQQTTFAQTHRLFVAYTALRAPDQVIGALPNVVRVGEDITACPSRSLYYATATQIAEMGVPTPPLVTPLNWEEQLTTLPGVMRFEIPYTTSCGTAGSGGKAVIS